MTRTYDDWKSAAPDLYAPDAPPDVEAVDEIHYYVMSALFQASEGGSKYEGKRGQFLALIRAAAEILDEESPVIAAAERGQCKLAAKMITEIEQRRFGIGWGLDQPPAWRDPELQGLKDWLNRRVR